MNAEQLKAGNALAVQIQRDLERIQGLEKLEKQLEEGKPVSVQFWSASSHYCEIKCRGGKIHRHHKRVKKIIRATKNYLQSKRAIDLENFGAL